MKLHLTRLLLIAKELPTSNPKAVSSSLPLLPLKNDIDPILIIWIQEPSENYFFLHLPSIDPSALTYR